MARWAYGGHVSSTENRYRDKLGPFTVLHPDLSAPYSASEVVSHPQYPTLRALAERTGSEASCASRGGWEGSKEMCASGTTIVPVYLRESITNTQ